MNRDFSNLSRKYKMSISSNIYNSGHAEIPCLGLTPATKDRAKRVAEYLDDELPYRKNVD
jgi:sulfite reductase beta subunit-like hemoprotein